MQKFKVGDKVKIVKNSYSGFWPASDAVFVVKDFHRQDVDIEGLDNRGKMLLQIYSPDDLELITQEHPNQKLANEVADILREAADFFLVLPSGKRPTQDAYKDYSAYSCCAVWYCSESRGWSTPKRKRVMDRFLRSLGVNPQEYGQIPSHWKNAKKQQTRHAWLYIAAQFAEENPDLVPTYGKKKVKV